MRKKQTFMWVPATFVVCLGFLVGCTQTIPASEGTDNRAPNGIILPSGFEHWDALSVSHRTDNQSLRLIIGNDIAVKASRSGQTLPWPDGAILGKLVWKDTVHEQWEAATVPDKFVHIEFMIKDAVRFSSTGGWGYARFLGGALTPYGDDEDFVQECFACHTPVAAQDYVFTRPPLFPGR